MRQQRSQQRGFTLIEMMVALVLFAAVTAGMMSVAVTMTNGYRDQEVTIATETSTRSAIEFMSQGLRGASPGVSDPNKITDVTSCAVTAQNNAFRVEQNLVVAGLASKPDAFTVVMPVGQVLTTTTSTFAGTSVNVSNAAELSVDDQVLVTDHDVGSIMRIASKAGNTLTMAAFGAGPCGTVAFPVGSTVIRVMRARFSVGFLAGENVPMLFMDADAEGGAFIPEPIAEGIEDMQISVGIDNNPVDKVIGVENASAANADEWVGNNLGDTPYTNQAGVRAIRITLVARTAKEATGINAYKLPAIEDRVANALTDNFRRRILSSTIEVRNLGGSP